MLTSIAEFEHLWEYEANATRKLFAELTDASLAQAVVPGHRTLGRMAWHITTSVSEMMTRVGLTIAGPPHDAPVPASAAEIKAAYDAAASSLVSELKAKWTDATLKVEDDMYGEKWSRAQTLHVLMGHQIHHRGQVTVLMRQAGLKVPGVYGPAKEEWGAFGAPPPEV